jgi:hypothetical protein
VLKTPLHVRREFNYSLLLQNNEYPGISNGQLSPFALHHPPLLATANFEKSFSAQAKCFHSITTPNRHCPSCNINVRSFEAFAADLRYYSWQFR